MQVRKNKKINNIDKVITDKDAIDLFTKTLKSGLGSMKYEIKNQVASTNFIILVTRVYLEFIKANTVKL